MRELNPRSTGLEPAILATRPNFQELGSKSDQIQDLRVKLRNPMSDKTSMNFKFYFNLLYQLTGSKKIPRKTAHRPNPKSMT